MAAQGRTTGAQDPADELRRRNVASQTTVPAVAKAPASEKSKEKVGVSRAAREPHFLGIVY